MQHMTDDNCCRRRSTLALLCILGLASSMTACDMACRGSQAEKFVCEFEKKVDVLVDRIHDAKGTKTVTMTVYSGGRMGDFDKKVSRLSDVAPAAIDVAEHFPNMPMTLYLQWSSTGMGEAEGMIRDALTAQRPRVLKEVEWLETQIRQNPDAYVGISLLVETPSFLGGYPPYGWTDDGDLYVSTSSMAQSQRIILKRILDFDEEKLFEMFRPKDAQSP